MLTRLLPRRVMACRAVSAFVLYFLVNDQEQMCEFAGLCWRAKDEFAQIDGHLTLHLPIHLPFSLTMLLFLTQDVPRAMNDCEQHSIHEKMQIDHDFAAQESGWRHHKERDCAGMDMGYPGFPDITGYPIDW